MHCVVIVHKHSSKKSYVVYQCRSGFNLLIVDVTVRGEGGGQMKDSAGSEGGRFITQNSCRDRESKIPKGELRHNQCHTAGV